MLSAAHANQTQTGVGTVESSPATKMPIGSDAAKMAGLALMAVLLVVAPQWAMGATKQMKMSKTLSFDDNIGDALADLIGAPCVTILTGPWISRAYG